MITLLEAIERYAAARVDVAVATEGANTYVAGLIQAEYEAASSVLGALLDALKAALTDAQVEKAARVLSDRNAVVCNVNKDDEWKEYRHLWISDARAMLEAIK